MEFLILWIGFAVVTAIAASGRGRSGGGWFLLGLIFGVFALIAVLVMPRVTPDSPDRDAVRPDETKRRTELRRAAEAERAAAAAADSMPCPRCAETIKKAAKICRFCQLDLDVWRAEKAPVS